ncbi:kinase-like domain-containing protein [Rhizophagus irregularis DAOM 181602=DAOM 197198]|uniref:Kinase-like domain-containing protein n=1 Tax=Rhizophagus irregularis (strain DAOM 181602 / DAOM 197198 / MUCL 43194) TaxID=747089 RepID=A0A2P4QCS1_RHIID|nr:kinase-like domain-containing protein [Rhizophagus irregularis DAOM 181602=DAOM 197198]POG75414.1 kinase-like domain-containing protein [Rhizophagus irregularis DAOM 181602=DAOM 197198]|eukprot:XP_025182280.1 kinase-like domain-containing protein [Rhizophagus irregularis DAOM 181602=DAOM 197198]
MSPIRYELVYATTSRATSLIDYNIYTDMHQQHEFKKQFILTDKLLTDNEKAVAIKRITETYDRNKVLSNTGSKRICETCKQECLATLYCEYCIRNYLKDNFLNWTSGNDDIDNLILKCQMECLGPGYVIEWIPYNNFKNIKYLTKGGFSEIYTADWINGNYEEWDSEKQQLRRSGTIKIVLKKLENVESANQSWFEEAESHLTMSAKLPYITRCCGLTQDISDGNYMLVIMKMDMDLRKYLQQNYNQLTWKGKFRIVYEIIEALYWIHKENAIHRDLHSGNILFSQFNDGWYISDLGFCGPADKSSKSIYGNLPYIAPEVINGKGYTFASDIYSIAILMWEISSGQLPFINYKHDDYDLAMDIINGMRPEIVSEIPLEYKNLMEQCWDADPSKRPDIDILIEKIREIHLLYQNKPNELFQLKAKNNSETKTNSNYTSSSRVFTSKIHQFDNLPEPKNATEGEQEGFHSKTYDFNIPDNIDDFNNSSNQKTSKINNYFKASSKRLSKVFKKLQINSKNDIQNDNKKETIQQQIKGPINDEEVYDSPNLHSEEQDELEIPDEIPSDKLN